MLGKLIKHEFRATGRVMLPMLIALAALAVLANISFAVLDHVGNAFLSMLLGLVIAAYFIGIFALGVIAVVIMVERFYHNFLCDQGYLMLTLPTNVHSLIWSKLIVSLVWFLVTALAIMLSLVCTVLTVTSLESVIEFKDIPSMAYIIEAICRETGLSAAQLVALGVESVLSAVLAALVLCLHFYAAMSIGHIFASRKVLMSIVFFFVINIAMHLLFVVAALLTGAGLGDFFTELGFEVFAYGLHFVTALSLVEGALMYFATAITLKKGLNLA